MVSQECIERDERDALVMAASQFGQHIVITNQQLKIIREHFFANAQFQNWHLFDPYSEYKMNLNILSALSKGTDGVIRQFQEFRERDGLPPITDEQIQAARLRLMN